MANTKKTTDLTGDLHDSERDKRELENETTQIDMPDVSEIPGQENIKPAPMGDLADVTMSSADEEGDDLFDDDIDEEIENDPDSNVSQTEKNDLENTFSDMPTEADTNLRLAALDNTDDDGTPLNEGSFKNNISGTDLDVPGADLDDDDEEIGEEDEENNEYSLGGDNHDDIAEDNA